MALHLQVVTHSEVGLVRKNNQDSGFASPRLVVVADGMGGAAAGDLASAVAIDTLRKIDTGARGEEMLELLAGAIHKANDRIADLIEDDYSLEGMGTTLTGALFDGSRLGLAHIGDSRAYLLRDGTLQRLTHDHSWVQSLVDDGKISEAEAAVHPHRSLLLRVLNGQTTTEPDLTTLEVRAGDRLLFCSDGLCGLVDDDEIAAALAEPDRSAVLERLVDLAHAAGGIDNITIILADVVDGPPEAVEPVVLGAAAEREVPVPATRTPPPEEDTVVSDRVPAAGAPATAGAAAQEPVEDEARYNPRAPHRRRLLRPLLLGLVALLVLGAGLGAGYAWTRSQYFVGAAADQVAIFRGIPDSVPGISLSEVYEIQPLAVSALPPYYQDRVRASIAVSDLDSARRTVQELTDAAVRCAGQPSAQPTGSPSPRPSDTASPGPSPTADPSGPAAPQGTATPPPNC